MASKKENIKALFSNTKSRTIILFTAIALITIVVIGFFKLTSSSSLGLNENANIKSAPTNISSIPGSQSQTAQYAALQEQQNQIQAQIANKTGVSAIPTIIRTQAFGEGVELIGPKDGSGGVGFTTLALADEAGPQQSLWTEALKKDDCNPVTLKRIINEGASLSNLRPMCSCQQLKENGYTLKELIPVCACLELKSAGFGAADLKSQGYTAEKLKKCGFSACETRGAGFTANEMSAGGYSDGELKGAGFSDADIAKAGGVPDGVSAEDILKARCNPDALRQLRARGVTAAAIVRMSGCSAEQLRAAGYTAEELKAAGFTAAELKAAGFNPQDLLSAGFSPRDLLDAGYSADDLKRAGVSDQDLNAANSVLPPAMTLLQLQQSGCSDGALKRAELAGVSPAFAEQTSGCSLDAIKAAGCDLIKLKKLHRLGISAARIREVNHCRLADLLSAGFTANDLNGTGFSPEDLKAAHVVPVSLDAIRAASCDPVKLKALRAQGVSAKQIHDINGCSAAALRAAGFSAQELADLGMTPADLLAAGFTPDDLTEASLIPSAVIAAGRTAECSVDSLKAARAAGVSAKTIRQTLGCSVAAMRAAGYTAAELKAAGFSAAELKNAGFSVADLKAAGFPDEVPIVSPIKPEATQSITPPATPSTSPPSVLMSPVVINPPSAIPEMRTDTKQLQNLMTRQQIQMADQRYQAKIKQRTGAMLSAAKESLQRWKKVPDQVLVAGSKKDNSDSDNQDMDHVSASRNYQKTGPSPSTANGAGGENIIKTGDILFAVMDTSVNTDEPGPILATIVSGRLKGSKLIGSFTLPANASKMVISFNTISIPGADKTVSISAYAIDPNTARTALASEANHHYLQRYGALFASSFMAGMSSAIQSSNTTVSVGGTGGTTNTTVSTLSRSTLDNALIALGEVGKAWSQTAQKEMNRPTTVEVYAGTGLGILFTQDVSL